MLTAALFMRGNRGNRGNSLYSCGFSAFPVHIWLRERGNRITALFPLFPVRFCMGERLKAFIHAVVPPVPSVPCEKQRGGKRTARLRQGGGYE